MKYMVFLIFVISWPLVGQNHDLSVWGQRDLSTGKNTIYPWYMYTGEKFTADLRYNYDSEKTGTACLGKKFGSESFTVVPEACGYTGKTNGYGPEILMLGSGKKFEYFIQNQYFHGTRPDDSFWYNWSEARIKTHKNFGIGFAGQGLQTKNEGGKVDIGFSAKISLGKAYIGVYPVWSVDRVNRGTPTLYLSTGYIW